MIGKMVLRSALTATVAVLVWHTPVAQSIANQVNSVTNGTSNFSALASVPGIGTLFDSGQAATAYEPVGRCDITLMFDAEGAPKGTTADLRAAAATMSTLTGMSIDVVRATVTDITGYAAAHDYIKIPAQFISSNEITNINGGSVPYALTNTGLSEGKKVTAAMRFNREAFATLETGTGANSRYTVFLHELGHVAGLGHNAAGSSLMAETPEVSSVTDQDREDLLNATSACR